MIFKVTATAIAVAASLASQPAWAATAAPTGAEQTSLSQCVVLRTSGADRLLTARWFFALMSRSPQIADLATVPNDDVAKLNKAFAQLLTRLIIDDCIDEVRPLAAKNMKDAFEQVGQSLGKIAMQELLGDKEVAKGAAAYTDYLSADDFTPLTDSIGKSRSK
jgi:hypothetical protein